MTLRSRGRPALIGAAALVTVAVAVPLVVVRHGSAAATVRVAPLSATDRRVLAMSRPLIDALPQALSQVPIAASDATGGSLSPAEASRVLATTPALGPLSRAIANPSGATGTLLASYRAATAGQQVSTSVDQLARSLGALQAIEAEITPAIRVVVAHDGGALPSAPATENRIARDRHTTALAGVIAGWQQIYGSFTLVEQAAAGQ